MQDDYMNEGNIPEVLINELYKTEKKKTAT